MTGRDIHRLAILKQALRSSWSAETSSDPAGWSWHNPAWGQCAVTALIIQDAFGGDLVRVVAKLPDDREISHYFNRLPDCDIDLTSVQFPQETEFSEPVVREREYVLSFPETAARYRLLKEKLDSKDC